jgi:flagellar hook-basal body complex protein FliE
MISGIGALSNQIGGGSVTGAATSAASVASPGGSFADLVSDVVSNTVASLQNAEQVSVKAISGDVDTREVVDAVMSAEQSLQAAIAIRDKIVSAYIEVSRMQI